MKNFFLLELKIQSRHWSFYLACVLSFLFGLFLINNQTPDNDILLTGSYFISRTFVINILLLPVIVSIFSASALVRDFDNNSVDLIYSSCSNKYQLLLSRYFALVIVALLICVSFGLGIYFGLWLKINGSTSEALTQHFSTALIIQSLLWILGTLVLPNILLLASLFLILALKLKKSIYLYLSAAVVYLGYQIFLAQTGSPIMANPEKPNASLMWFIALFDPFGVSAYFEQVEHLAASVKNNQLPQLDGALLINRVIVIGSAIALTWLTINRYALHTPQWKSPQRKAAQLTPGVERLNHIVVPERSQANLWLRKVVTICKMEYGLTIKTKVFAATALLLALFTGSEIYFGYTSLESLGVSAIASMPITLDRFLFDILPNFGSLFILLLATELCWRDHNVGFKSLIDTSNVSNLQLFGGRLAALLMVPVSFITVCITTSILLQLVFDGEISVATYLSLYGLIGLPMFCIAAMCICVHALVKNRFIGLAITFAVFITSKSSLMSNIGLEHDLWRFTFTPVEHYSDITGFSANLDGFWGYMAIWLPLSALLLLIGFGLFRRGTDLAFRYRFSRLTDVWGKAGTASAAAMLILSATAVGNVYNKTVNQGYYQSSQDNIDFEKSYEKNYGWLKDKPTLKADKILLDYDLYPSEKRANLIAQYQLSNQTTQVIEELYITTPKGFNFNNLKVTNAELISFEQRFGIYQFQFNQPLSPGQRVTFNFDAQYQQNGYQALRTDSILLENIMYFRNIRYLPVFGFLPHYQLQNPDIRKQQGLPELEQLTLEQDITRHQGDFSHRYDWAELETRLTTAHDHIAVAPGKLVTHSEHAGRKTFHYKTNGKIRNIGHFLSTNMQLSESSVDGINIQLFHQPGKDEYVTRYMESIKDTLKYGNTHFGRYLGEDLRMFEMPNMRRGKGYALPQTILMSEKTGFNSDLQNNEAFDHTYRRAAHEVAHQWWGHGLNGAATEGEGVLIETLAKYTEMIVLEKKYGIEYVKRLIQFEQQRYFRGKANDWNKELPLYRGDENHLIYSKGSAAMYALRHLLGEDKMNLALSTLVTNHSYPKPPATTIDLISLLKRGATSEQIQQIDFWLKQTNFSDWYVDKAEVRQLADNSYQLDVCVANHNPVETFVPAPILHIRGSEGNNINQQKIIDSRQQCNQWLLTEKPEQIIIDPELYTLDSNRDNNEILVTTE